MSLDRIWNTVQQFLQSHRSTPENVELAEIRHSILDRVRANISELSAGRYLFPFDRILIEIRPRSPSERAAMQTAWIDRSELEADIRAALSRADCEYPPNLAIETRLRDMSAEIEPTAELFWLTLENSRKQAANASASQAPAPLHLTVLSGSADPASLELSAANTNIGRLREVFDPEGQFIRRNELAFDETDNGVNETVSRTHAHITRQRDGRFALTNSRRNPQNATAILRNGRSIPVILVAEPLEPGDIIQLGRARIRVD